MPYVSDKQRKFMHANAGKPGTGITKKMVHEFDNASRGMDLPERAKKSSLNLFGYLAGLITGLEKDSVDMSEIFRRNPDMSTESTQKEKIKNFMQNDTIDAIISKVKSDYSIPESEKERIIRSLLGMRQSPTTNTGISGGSVAGGVGGLLLSLLALSGTQLSTPAKLLIGSLMTGAGGLLGNVLGSGGLREEGPLNTSRTGYKNI